MQYKDTFSLLTRYVRSSSILGSTMEMRTSLVKHHFQEFKRGGHFSVGYHPIKHTDHYKAALLFAITRILKPAVVVETGVASGHSSLGILAALELNRKGHLYSIDKPNAEYITDSGTVWSDLTDRGVGWLVPVELRPRWTLRLGHSAEQLPRLINGLDHVDLFYHDSEHTLVNMLFELETCWSKMATGGVIVADNINWNSAFYEFCSSKRIPHSVLFPFVGITRKRCLPQ